MLVGAIDIDSVPITSRQLGVVMYFHTFTCVMHLMFLTIYTLFSGQENYENQMRFGKRTFAELENLNKNGIVLKGIQHSIDIVSCSDWKAGACLEGMSMNISLKDTCVTKKSLPMNFFYFKFNRFEFSISKIFLQVLLLY